MYGNYSHFMKFPTGFGGECRTIWSIWGKGGDMAVGAGWGTS